MATKHSTLAQAGIKLYQLRHRGKRRIRTTRAMLRSRNLFSRCLRGDENNGGKIAVHAGDRSYSYADLAENSARYANALTGLGVGPGERACVYVDKSIENVFLYLACLRAGLVYQPLNPAFQPAEVLTITWRMQARRL